MICAGCKSRLAWRASSLRQLRQISNTPRSLQASSAPNAPRGPPTGDRDGPPAATSTSAAQPFSTPGSSSTSLEAATAAGLAAKPQAQARSSVPAGTPLTGLAFYKNRDPPVALEDHQYPEWLWTILDSPNSSTKKAADAQGDAFSKTRSERRRAAKAARKAAGADLALHAPKVPIDQQTIDLPSGGGSLRVSMEASAAREQLTAAMRSRRRGSIKEGNFLKGMP